MNVLMNLAEAANSLSTDSIYRNLAKQILENLDEMKKITIYDLAEITNSSRTTVWRLVTKLGYASFSDFRYALQSASRQYTYYNRLLPAEYCRDSGTILKKSMEELKNSAKLLKECVSHELLEELTDELFAAEKVRFYTPFRMGTAYSLQINLAKCGQDTAYCCLLPEMLEDTNLLDSKSIVIINTLEHAETLDMTEVFTRAKGNGARIWLAGESSSQFDEYADRKLIPVSATPIRWMFTYETLLFMLSERYRSKFLD